MFNNAKSANALQLSIATPTETPVHIHREMFRATLSIAAKK